MWGAIWLTVAIFALIGLMINIMNLKLQPIMNKMLDMKKEIEILKSKVDEENIEEN